MKTQSNLIEKTKDLSLSLYSIMSTFSLAAINLTLGITLLLTIFQNIKEKPLKVENKISKSVIIFLIAILASLINSLNLESSLDYLNRFIYPFIAFFIIRLNNFSFKKIKKYISLILISIFLNLIYAYYQYFNGVSRIHGNLFVMEFAGLLSFLVIFCFIYLWNPVYSKKNKYFVGILFSISVIAIVLTGTRGVWVSLTSSIFILLFLLKRKKMYKYILIFFLIVLMIFLILPNYYSNRLISIFDFKNNNSNLTRINLWRGAILIFKNNPVNGIGLNNFSEIIKNDLYYKAPMMSVAHAHNNYFQLLAETGFIGVLSFLFLNYKVIITLLNLVKKESNEYIKYYYYSVLGIYTNYLLQGLTEYNLVDRYMNIILWILIPFALNLSELNNIKKNKNHFKG